LQIEEVHASFSIRFGEVLGEQVIQVESLVPV